MELNCVAIAITELIQDLSQYDTFIFILSNVGDEELPPEMEEFLFKLKLKKKSYFVCELGNYFGFEDYCGCKKELFKIMDQLEWKLISDVSIDSLPKLDKVKLDQWVESIKKFFWV